MHGEKRENELFDDEFYEEIDPEERLELREEERNKSRQQPKGKAKANKTRFPSCGCGLSAFIMCLDVIPVFPRTFSIAESDFLVTSARLASDQYVQAYKEAVVVIESTDGKGTGFGITEDGLILTNHHVVDGEDTVLVNYPEDGLFHGDVISHAPHVDLALVQVNGSDLPYLSLAEQADFELNQSVLFIGNPVRFNGIANEGEWIGLSQRHTLETDVMMLNAPVHRGNSGSPVINSDGSVIGVIYATTNDDAYGRIGLAIPIENIDQLDWESAKLNE